MFTLIGFIPLLLIIFVIVVAVKNKNEFEKEGEDMFKQLYVYLVLFTMLLMTVGGGISIFMGVADYVSPNTYSQTFTEYKTNNITYDKNGDEVKSNKSDQELREEYNQSLKDDEVRAKNDAKHQIISSLGFIVIPFPIFLYFNRQRKKDFPKAA